MKDYEKDYWKSMLNEDSSFTKGDYRDALSELLLRLDKNLQDKAMANMSSYICALENQCTAEQIREASQGAAAPLLNGRDQYNRAEAWKRAAKLAKRCWTIIPHSQHRPAMKAFKDARELEKD